MSTAPLKTVGVDQQVSDFFVEHFTQQLSLQAGLRVSSAADVTAVLGLERQKQLLGCSDDSSSCLAELAGALGVDAIVTGTIAKVGSAFTVNLRALGAADARPLSVLSERCKTEDEVLDALARAAVKIADELREQLAPTAAPRASGSSASLLQRLAFVPAGAGVVAGAVALVALGLANDTAGKLSAGDPNIASRADLDAALRSGKSYVTVSIALGVASAVALAATAVMLVLGKSTPAATAAAVTAFVTPGGAGLGVAGAWP